MTQASVQWTEGEGGEGAWVVGAFEAPPQPQLSLVAAAVLERQRRAQGAVSQAVRRLVPRFWGDALAVAIGIGLYELLDRELGVNQLSVALGFLAAALVMDATHTRIEWNYVEEFVVSVKTSLVSLFATATLAFLVHVDLSRTLFLSIAAVMTITKPVMAMVSDRRSTSKHQLSDVALVMCGDEEYAELVTAAAEPGSRPLHWMRIWDRDDQVPPPGFVGRRQDLVELCRGLRPDKVVFGRSPGLDGQFLRLVAEVNEMGIPVRSFARSFAEDFGRVPIASLDTSWFLFDIAPLHRIGYRIGRRVLDVAAGLVAGIVMLVLAPALALVVRLDSPGPFLYRQQRVGQRGRSFTMFKIRTMCCSSEPNGPVFAQKNDDRVTRVGRLLRRSRLDELPQAINLLRGDMTLIGPRPERPEWVSLFEAAIPYYEKRHLMKPGLTGWAQVHEGYGNSHSDTTRKLERDLYYLRNRSLGLDIRILMGTVGRVVSLAGQ